MVLSSSKLDSARPSGVTAIAVIFFFAAVYLFTTAVGMLIWPEAASPISAAPLLSRLSQAGPDMAMRAGIACALIGWGLFHLRNWARWTAVLLLGLEVWWLAPKISSAKIGAPLLWYGLQIAIHTAAVWYLAQSPSVTESFAETS